MLTARAILGAIRRFPAPCRRQSELISCALDEALPDDLAAALCLHLARCRACRGLDQQLRFLVGALRRMGERGVGPGARRIPADVRRNLERRLRAPGPLAGQGEVGAPAVEPR